MGGSVQELDSESAVRARYSGAGAAREAALCCPVAYDPRPTALPEEVLARDDGYGDPTRHFRGVTVEAARIVCTPGDYC